MPHADIIGQTIILNTQWNEKDEVKLISGARWDIDKKHWTVPLTWTSCIQLRGVFGDRLTTGPALDEWAWKPKHRSDFLMFLRAEVDLEKVGGRVIMDDRLYPFQQVGATFVHLAKEALLGDEMGTGKTVQVCAALTTEALPALVVCPNSVKQSWHDHIRDWTTATPYVVTGGAVGRKKILDAAAKDPRAVVITNYEALRSLTRLAPYGSIRLKRCRACDKKNGEETLSVTQCQVHPKQLNGFPFRTVVVDEAHRIKDPKSQQTRAVWAVAHQDTVLNRWALTGTPLANHPGDLWALLHAISPTDFPTKTHFVDRYCLQSWNAYGGLDIVGINPATRGEFYALLDPRFRRMPKDLVLSQLPPKVRSTRWVDMAPAQRKAYDQLDAVGAAMLEADELLVPATQLVEHLRKMQLASATLVAHGGGYVMSEPSTKLDAMDEVLDELGPKQVVISAESRQLIELAAARIKKRGMSFGLITGSIVEYERQVNLRRFQAGEIQVLLFTVKAGGTGLTMTAADTMIRLQRSWSMIDNKQAEDRIHRIGAERHESIHIIDIVARDTVEEDQMGKLIEKQLRLEEIVRDRATLLAANLSTHELDVEEDLILRSELL